MAEGEGKQEGGGPPPGAPGGPPLAPLDALRADIRGDVYTRDAEEGSEERKMYDARRAVDNSVFDRKPTLVVCPRNVCDVQRALAYAREHVEGGVCVKGGGHALSGSSQQDDTLMLDLGLMRSVHVDPEDRVVWVEGGAWLGDVDAATQPHNLCVPLGAVSHTGVGGLTLGGGVGMHASEFGLSIDNLLAVDVVLADGTYKRVTEESDADLFWALRGGGQGLCVCTAFKFRAHQLKVDEEGNNVLGGIVVFDYSARDTLLRKLFELSRDDSETGRQTYCAVVSGTLPPAGFNLVCAIVFCSNSDWDTAQATLDEWLAAGPVMANMVTRKPHREMNCVIDHLAVPFHSPWSWSARGILVENLVEDADIAEFAERYGAMVDARPDRGNNVGGVLLMEVIGGGAVTEVAPDATAFPHRQQRTTLAALGVLDDGARRDEFRAWGHAGWERFGERYCSGNMYVNFGEDDILTADNLHGANRSRLQEVRASVDPGTLFKSRKDW